MWKEALIGFALEPLQQDASLHTSLRERLSGLAMYSEKSVSANANTIFALNDCYVDYLSNNVMLKAGERVFQLNTYELDRETFKLGQERAFAEIASRRLDPQYLAELVYRPLEAAIDLAEADLAAASEELKAIRDMFAVGDITRTAVSQAEARYYDRLINRDKAMADISQRRIEIDGQIRNLVAEEADLEERIELNKMIRDIYGYTTRSAARADYHVAAGCFVEEGDPIVTLNKP